MIFWCFAGKWADPIVLVSLLILMGMMQHVHYKTVKCHQFEKEMNVHTEKSRASLLTPIMFYKKGFLQLSSQIFGKHKEQTT